MCLQSPEYDLIGHMLSVNKWILNSALPHGMEELEEQVDYYTEGEYLNSCNDLQELHKKISKSVEDYSFIMNKVDYQDRIRFTKQCLSARHEVVNIKSYLGNFSFNLEKEEILYQAFIVNGHTLTNRWNFG